MVKKSQQIVSVFLLGFFFLTGFALPASGQKIDAFARVSVTPREGVVRQPYRVNISVYSSTWFASPLQFANLRIDNAFIIPFTRTVSGINYINNKKYATLTFYYLVFPYNSGILEIPELVINASIPPEGDYKGQAVTIRTSPQTIKIKPVPSSENQEVWMVAKNITVKESWSRSLENLKVGDVIEREIAITANGTLPSLIEPLEVEKPDFTSIYPKEPDLLDKRTNQDVNGLRTERYSYLFEEEGEVTIPAEEVLWWNPETKRVYRRTIAEQKITIVPNPDLAMMESLKDSLLAMSAVPVQEAEEKNIPWLSIGLGLFLLLMVLYWGIKTIIHITSRIKKRRNAYLKSEAYYFKKVQRTLHGQNTEEFICKLYIWFDRARSPEESASLSSFLNTREQRILESIFENTSSKPSSVQTKRLKAMLIQLRKNVVEQEKQKQKTSQINPL